MAGSIPLLLGAPPLSVQDVYSYGDARVFGRASGLWEAVVESGTFGIFVFMTGLLQDLWHRQGQLYADFEWRQRDLGWE